jgi:hypothetical protein
VSDVRGERRKKTDISPSEFTKVTGLEEEPPSGEYVGDEGQDTHLEQYVYSPCQKQKGKRRIFAWVCEWHITKKG